MSGQKQYKVKIEVVLTESEIEITYFINTLL